MKVSNVPVSIVHVHYENAIRLSHVFILSNDDFFSIVDSKKFKPIRDYYTNVHLKTDCEGLIEMEKPQEESCFCSTYSP